MTWHCKACTYININDGAIRCHACETHRPSNFKAPVIVDLTEVLSPSPTRGDNNIMESCRSRRRRRLDQSTPTKINDEDINLSNSFSQKGEIDCHHQSAHENTHLDSIQQMTFIAPVDCDPTTVTNAVTATTTRDSNDDGMTDILSTRKKHSLNTDSVVRHDSRPKKRQQHCSEQTSSAHGHKQTDIHSHLNLNPHSIETLLDSVHLILRQTFAYKNLRPLQEKAINNILQKKSSILVMATGGGKSLCYQLPALLDGSVSTGTCTNTSKVTIVVCPLIALMLDQVNNLLKRGIHTAACLSSSHSAKAKQEILNRLQISTPKQKDGGRNQKSQSFPKILPIQLLYCTPEMIETDRFRAILADLHKSKRLNFFAVDEAHCLSTWGHDFRPAYRKLTWVRETFPDVPVVACTGTATAKVIQDIRTTLKMDADVPCFMGTFNRSNITYEVRFKDSLNATKPQGAILDLVATVKEQHDVASKNNQPCSGIIYVHKREDCQSLASIISKSTGISCLAYHAGLKDADREATQRQWTDGKCSIAVATVAFGMGIDLPHVRYVIHWTMAKSLEGFYQESGRAGRDGNPSRSILYYSQDDASTFSYLIKLNAERAGKKKSMDSFNYQQQDHSLVELEGMVNYCMKPMCKRKYVLGYFGENIDAGNLCNKTCDFCKNPSKVERDIQASKCMLDVIDSHRLIRSGGKEHKHEQNKFHCNPLDDESLIEDYESCDDLFGYDDEFSKTADESGHDSLLTEPTRERQGFASASAVLSKYAKIECQEGKKGGFVNFKTKIVSTNENENIDGKKYRAVNIPNHLRVGMPDPFAGHNKVSRMSSTTGSNISESDRLKAELAELQKKKEDALAKMGGTLISSRPVLSTPSLCFKKQR